MISMKNDWKTIFTPESDEPDFQHEQMGEQKWKAKSPMFALLAQV